MYRTARSVFLLAIALLPAALSAQDATKRPLTLDDYGAWSRIRQVTLSQDGAWLAYAEQPNDGDARFFIRSLEGGAVYDAVNGSGPEFSDDGRWVAFLTSPPEKEAKALKKKKEPVSKTLRLIDLTSGERTEEAAVRSFAFSDGGRFLAIRHEKSDRDAEHEGADLLLRDLTAGSLLSFGNVSEYGFNEGGALLAYVVDAEGESGNGIYLVSPETGRIRPLDTEKGRYEDLAWNEAGDALAVLRGEKPEGKTRRTNALVVASRLDSSRPEVGVYDPASDGGFPDGFVLSELADTRWTEDGRVLLGIKPQEDEAEEADGDDDEKADVDVWHWADERLQSQQMVQADADRRYSYLSVYNPGSRHFFRLATDEMQRVDVTDDGRWGIGRRDGPYRGDVTQVGGRADYVRIELDTGAQTTIVEALQRPMGTSPDGDWFLFLRDGHVRATNIETLETTDLSEAAGVDFVNHDFDLPQEAPAYGVGGWTEDGGVLLNTKFDVWKVALDGSSAVALSGGKGEADRIRFRVVRLDPEEDYIEPDGALLSAYGEWTKKSGYFRARPGAEPERLIFEDEMIGQLRKAEDADRVVFTRQTFETFPDYWRSDLRFRSPERVTDANPQIDEFAWGRRVLVDYTDERGHELQATLALPAGYEEGKRYPMIIYFYEKMSQRHHQFSQPVYDDRPHMSTYASNGYLVLMPDIVYDEGYPGSSALDDVTSAARKVIDLGYADPDHIGLQGHSWGGYESSFILTQTDMFAAVVTGAPLTDLMSMYNINYKRTGFGNGPLLEWSQGRLGVTPWDDFDRYASQSPIHNAPNISTPFIILHGTNDGAVDWNQGLEFYNAARRLGKKVILLSYPGEPHHLAKEANQKDFQTRMKQFFDHYLMGAPAPEWMERGVPFLDKGKRGPAEVVAQELPSYKIPNIPRSAEAYYAPDNVHVIAQVQDPDAQHPENRKTGALTYTFTDRGEEIRRINDRGQDACAFYFPDQQRIAWTSTRDHMEMPLGNWSDEREYPQGAELYISDLDGGNVVRLTNNEWYEAEVSVSPDGEWVVFGRQIDGAMDLWRMRVDGTDEQQITHTPDWQEGAPFYLPDGKTILSRAWKRSEYGKIRPTPMTVFTIDAETGERVQRTFDHDMNWAPYPAPDGRHYVFVRVVEDNNWEIFLGDLAGGEPVRLTFNDSFDGFPALSPDGTKMLFSRSEGPGFMAGLYTYVMDVSSLNLGPENYRGIPEVAGR